ncbi:MAG: hypothetical protein GY866_15485 [Proteobacteria bacterium]|nr:hypothetical protein [Pseudomonadota bacterium]
MTIERKVKASVKFFYGIGSTIEILQGQIFNILLFFYYVQALGLSGTLAGTATFFSMFADAVSDPVVGSLTDRSKSKYGRRHPFMAFAVVPFLLTFYLLFVPPSAVIASQGLLFTWLLVFGILVKLFVTVYAVPHLAMGGELSLDYIERSKIMTMRHLCGATISLGVLIVGFRVFFKKTADGMDGRLVAEQYPKYMLVVVIVSLVVMFSTIFFTRKEIRHMSTVDEEAPGFGLQGLFADMLQAIRNQNYRYLLYGLCFVGLAVGILETLTLHINTYFFELSSAQISQLFIGWFVGTLVAAAIIVKFHRWVGKRTTMLACILIAILVPQVPIVLRLFGLFFPNHHPLLFPSIMIFQTIALAGVAGVLITAGSMLGDVADESELQTNQRQEGIFYSTRMFMGKSVAALGHLVAGITLDYYVLFPKGGKDTVLPGDVAPDIIFRLGSAKAVLITVFAVIGCYFYSKYTITEAVHKKTLEQLTKTRSEKLGVEGEVN